MCKVMYCKRYCERYVPVDTLIDTDKLLESLMFRSVMVHVIGTYVFLSRTINAPKTLETPRFLPGFLSGVIQFGIQLTKITAPYLIRKKGVYYLQKRIPKDLVNYCGKEFIRTSLKTKSLATANHAMKSINQSACCNLALSMFFRG